MSPEKDKELYKDFPHLFRDRNANPMHVPFGFGFECSDGWYDLIRRAAEKLEPMIVQQIDDKIKNNLLDEVEFFPTTTQIKEKYGQLVWYMDYETDAMQEILSAAEDESATICEQCGKPGELRGKGWLYTACEECHEKYLKEHHA